MLDEGIGDQREDGSNERSAECITHIRAVCIDSERLRGTAFAYLRRVVYNVSRLLRLTPAHVTFLVTPMLYERVKAEISRSFVDEDAHLQDLITYVVLLSLIPIAHPLET